MTGSLQIKNDKYYMVINLDSPSGRRRQKWLATGLDVKNNKKKAEKMLRETLNKLDEEGYQEPSALLFADAIRDWLKEAKLRVDPVSYQGYETLAERHVIPYFEKIHLKLVDVDRQMLQRYINEKHEYGRMDGKGGLSPRSVKMHKNILYQTLSRAVRDGLIRSNPCEFLILPQSVRHEAHFYTEQQLNILLDCIKDEPLYPVVKITAVYGLRRSEVLGLKWDSVDFVNNTLTIKHTVSKVTKTVEKDKTKTASSFRSFPLLPEIREMLLELQKREKKNRRVCGKDYHENDYILKWDDGTPFSPDFVTRKFSQLLEKHGLPHIRFHELRHSCASFLLNNGFTLKDVQEWLGHVDISVTANIYGHLDVARKQGIANKLSESLLSGK